MFASKHITKILSVLLLVIPPCLLSGQGQNINVKCLKAAFRDTATTKNLVAVILVSTKDSASFPPAVMMPPKCTVFENGFEKVVLLDPQNIAMALHGENIVKNKEVYKLIKDLIDLRSLESSMIITYEIKNINFTFNRITLTQAFREKRNQSIRIEKRCEFDVLESLK